MSYLHDWSFCKYRTRNMSRVEGSPPMVRQLLDDTEEINAGREAVRPIYREDIATPDLSFYFAAASW